MNETPEKIHKRGIYLSEELAGTMKNIFGLKYETRTAESIKVRLSGDYYISNILRILLVLSMKRASYTELIARTMFRNEHVFVKYLKWMADRGWITRNADGIYEIAEKGRKFLDAF
jgi:predicted transcriptional regulator